MAKRVFVTGLGVVSAIGLNVHDTLESILSGKSGVSDLTLLNTSLKSLLPAAEIKHSDNELAAIAGFQSCEGMTRTTLLGMIAAGEAANHAGFSNDPSLNTGLILYTVIFLPIILKINTLKPMTVEKVPNGSQITLALQVLLPPLILPVPRPPMQSCLGLG